MPPRKRAIDRIADKKRVFVHQQFRVHVDLAASVQARVDRLLKRYIDRLHAIAPTEPIRRGDQLNRLDTLITETRALTRRTMRGINSTLTDTGITLAREDVRYTTGVMAQELGRDIAIQSLPGKVLERVANRALIEGAPTATWWQRQGDQLQRAFEDRVRRGLMQGSSPTEIMRAIKGTAKRGYKDGIMTEQRKGQVEALVRSSLSAVDNAIVIEESQQHDFVEGWQLFTTFDSKTCPTCAALSGGAFDFDGNPLEQSKVQIKSPVAHPPIHVNCRCNTIPVVEGEALVEDGYFGDWLANEPEASQREVLGDARYDLWKSNKLSMTDLVSQKGNPLTLRELRARYGKEAA